VRLYGFNHKRTELQFETAWNELQAALPKGQEGLLLGVSGSRLLLDGVPLESGQSERSFAGLLNSAGLTSIHFSSKVTADDFASLVRAFASTGGRAQAIAEQIRASLGEVNTATIKVNQVKFVAADPASGEVSIAAQLAAQTLGPEFKQWLNDPQKLLQLIAAAEGSKTGPSTQSAPVDMETQVVVPLEESEVADAIRLLTRFGQVGNTGAPANQVSELAQEIERTTPQARITLQQLLGGLARQFPAGTADTPLLMKAAEHLAIRFALERYERGEIRVNAVHQMMEHMSRQMESLKKILRVHEEKMNKAGMVVESHADILDRQFWAEVPESGKRSVLLSPDAACVPPRNVRQFVEELRHRKETDAANSILRNYYSCLQSKDPETRKKCATGLSQISDLYGAAGTLLGQAIHECAQELSIEESPEMQSLLSAAFVRLSQEASAQRNYRAIQEVLASINTVERLKPVLGKDIRPRIGVENRLPDFIEEALQSDNIPGDLIEALRRAPEASVEHMAERFSRCITRDQCDRLASLLEKLGQPATDHLGNMLRLGQVRQAAASVGLLSRINIPLLLELLPHRLRDWTRYYHDAIVRQIAFGGSPERGRILLELLDMLDPMVLPEAVDEIGMSGDRTTAQHLIVMAAAGITEARSPLLQVKAIEALSRLREPEAAPVLLRLVEDKKLFKYSHPRELRIAAAQALCKIDPEFGPALVSKRGIDGAEMEIAPLDPSPQWPWNRFRRYERVVPARTFVAVASSPWGKSNLVIRELSLGGGLARKEDTLRLGSEATLEVQSGMKNLRTQVMIRPVASTEVSFEIVDIALEERSKLRRILADQLHRNQETALRAATARA
jgi:hypothetical protein